MAGIALAAFPFDQKDFDKIVDFSLDMKVISEMVQNPSFDPDAHNRIVVFDGSVANILVINPDPEEFFVEIEIAGGEWAAADTVNLFRVFVCALGPQFEKRINGPAPDIARRVRLLVAGVIDSAYTSETDGKNYAVILAYHIRVIP